MTVDYFTFFNAVSPVPRGIMERLVQAGRKRVVSRGELITREGQVQRDLLLVALGKSLVQKLTGQRLGVSGPPRRIGEKPHVVPAS